MGRVLRTGIVIVCALVLVLPAGARRAETPTLTAIVGTNDGFTPPAPARKLSVMVKPASVPAGRYRLTVDDRGKRDNFHLRGRTVNKRTGLAFRGRVGSGVTLARGTYSYGSDLTGLKRNLRVR